MHRATSQPLTFLWGATLSTRVQGQYVHAHLKKEAYQPRNTKIPSSRRIAFSAKKRYHANPCYAVNRSIPFSCRSARVTLTHISPLTIYTVQVKAYPHTYMLHIYIYYRYIYIYTYTYIRPSLAYPLFLQFLFQSLHFTLQYGHTINCV